MDLIIEKEMEIQLDGASEYLLDIYTPLCFVPKELKVSWAKKDTIVMFTVCGNEKDDGILIGKGGATINSIRLLLHAYSKANLSGIPCLIEVKDHRGSNYNPVLAGMKKSK